MLSKAGNETYKYDVYNRLVEYLLDDGSKSESYTYDAEGVRRSKVMVGGEETKEIFFVSDTSNELSRTVAEMNENGDVLVIYSWGDTLLSQTREDTTSTYLYDGHGNVRGLLDEKGTLTDTYAYNAYGELTQRTGETENHYLYTGEYYDGTTNLYYLRARYMNPSTGTFISMDTYQGDMYGPVTLHKYLYANANPVKYSDPSGMFSLAEIITSDMISKYANGCQSSRTGSSSALNDISNLLKNGEKTPDGKNIITQLDDKTKLIFRMDVGENAHTIVSRGYTQSVNHINLEIQHMGQNGKYKPKWDFHIIVDDAGNINDTFTLGVWNK